MYWDEKNDAIEHMKSFAGVNCRIEDNGSEVIAKLPNKEYTYKRVMKESGLTHMQDQPLPPQKFIPYYKVQREMDGNWHPYMNRNWPYEGEPRWVRANA